MGSFIVRRFTLSTFYQIQLAKNFDDFNTTISIQKTKSMDIQRTKGNDQTYLRSGIGSIIESHPPYSPDAASSDYP